MNTVILSGGRDLLFRACFWRGRDRSRMPALSEAEGDPLFGRFPFIKHALSSVHRALSVLSADLQVPEVLQRLADLDESLLLREPQSSEFEPVSKPCAIPHNSTYFEIIAFERNAQHEPYMLADFKLEGNVCGHSASTQVFAPAKRRSVSGRNLNTDIRRISRCNLHAHMPRTSV
jgi:hypothetical protein